MRLSDAMVRELRKIAEGRDVDLRVVPALMARGLVVDNDAVRFQLRCSCRLGSAYPLTLAGVAALKEWRS